MSSRKYGKGVVYSRGYCLDSLLLENHILPDMKIEDDVPVLLFIGRCLMEIFILFQISRRNLSSLRQYLE